MAKVWLKPLGTTSLTPVGLDKKPTAILVPHEGKASYVESKIVGLERFVRNLEEYCGVEHTAFSICDLWREDPARPLEFPSLNEYLQNVSSLLKAYCVIQADDEQTVAHIQLHDCWQNASRFIDAYSEDKFGKLEIDPLIRYKWHVLTLISIVSGLT